MYMGALSLERKIKPAVSLCFAKVSKTPNRS